MSEYLGTFPVDNNRAYHIYAAPNAVYVPARALYDIVEFEADIAKSNDWFPVIWHRNKWFNYLSFSFSLIYYYLNIIISICYESIYCYIATKIIKIASFQTCIIRVSITYGRCNTDYAGI